MNKNKKEELRARLLKLVSEDMGILFSHKRLSEPFDDILDKALDKYQQMDEILSFIADEASRNAMAADGAISSLPEGQTKRAMDIMRRAWLHLHETCIFGIHEE